MTREEAIKILNPATSFEELFGLTREEGIKVVEEACLLAVADMEKQIPKKVVYHDDSGNKTVSERCPICFEIAHSDYCEYCGQALDWTEEGE